MLNKELISAKPDINDSISIKCRKRRYNYMHFIFSWHIINFELYKIKSKIVINKTSLLLYEQKINDFKRILLMNNIKKQIQGNYVLFSSSINKG